MENKKLDEPFTEEERRNIIELGESLRSIHDRLVREGYFMPSGKVWNIFKCTEPKEEHGRKKKKLV
jgi:hypothetical protein